MTNDSPNSDFILHERLAADCQIIGHFALCHVLLLNDARYPWFILVPRRGGISEAYQLSVDDQQQLTHESSLFGKAIMDLFKGDKLNIGALGNMVPQLHIHHIIRRKGDFAWPGAVWGVGDGVAYNSGEMDKIASKIAALGLKGYSPT